MDLESTKTSRHQTPDKPIDHIIRYIILLSILVPTAYAFIGEFITNWFLSP